MAVLKDEKRGTWYVHLKTIDPVTGKPVWKKKRGFALKREALKWEAEAREQTAAGKSVTFHQMADKWESFAQSSEHMKRKHREHFLNRFNDYYEMPITKISKKNLIEWRNSLPEHDNATRTLNTTIQYVKAVFRYAHDVYDMPNPAVFLKPLKLTDEEVMAEMEIWTVQEFNTFLSCVDKRIYQIFFRTLFWTGMRKGEAIALQKSDYSDGWINIHATQEARSDGLKPTKTKRSRRIRVDAQLAKDLQILADRDGAYLFGDDTPLAPSPIQREFTKAVEASGVKKIRIHDLRHSHASWLLNNGANILAVSKRLGHTDSHMTLKVYAHVMKDSDDQLMNIISNELNRKVAH